MLVADFRVQQRRSPKLSPECSARQAQAFQNDGIHCMTVDFTLWMQHSLVVRRGSSSWRRQPLALRNTMTLGVRAACFSAVSSGLFLGRLGLPSASRVRKYLSILGRPHFFEAAVRHRVAAATEHLGAIRHCKSNTLIDAGANKGQFSLVFRAVRPGAQILAFEPLPEAANVYERVFRGDRLTELSRVALSSETGTAQFHVADRSDSSSLLLPGSGQARAFGVRPAAKIEVSVKRLDQCIDISSLKHPLLLKVDVQGGELALFDGCGQLEQIDFIYVELSFVELYEGQPLFQEVCDYLVSRGFSVAGIFNQVNTAEFGPTQVDVLFRRCAGSGA